MSSTSGQSVDIFGQSLGLTGKHVFEHDFISRKLPTNTHTNKYIFILIVINLLFSLVQIQRRMYWARTVRCFSGKRLKWSFLERKEKSVNPGSW